MATTPRAPGGLWAAHSDNSSGRWPVSAPIHDTRDPAADSPPSSSQSSPVDRDSTIPAGTPSGRSATGTETLAVVPQLTMGQDSVAPEPSTSQGRSPAPMTTGVPATRPRASAEFGVSVPVTRSDGTTDGSRRPQDPTSGSTTRPSRS